MGLYVQIQTNSIRRYSGYLSGYISYGSSVQICRSDSTDIDELAVGFDFTDFKSLSAAVAQFENSNFVVL